MSRAKQVTVVLLGLAAVAAAVFLVPPVFQPTLESQIAKKLNIREENLVINMPPGPARLPGAIFIASGQLIPLDLVEPDDPRIRPGPLFDTEWKLKVWSSAQGSIAISVASELAKSHASRDVSITLKHARLLEMTANDLKTRLEKSSAAQRHGSKNLIIIVRAVAAIPEVRILRNRDASLQDWTKVSERAGNVPGAKVSLEGQQTDADALTFTISTSEVFAFETAKADFVTNDLGAGDVHAEVKIMTSRQFKDLLEPK